MRLSLESSVEEATVVPVSVAAPGGTSRRVPAGSSGVEEHARGDKGFCGNLGDPAISTEDRRRKGGRLQATPRPRDGASPVARERSKLTQPWHRQAKENEARRDGWPEVLAFW